MLKGNIEIRIIWLMALMIAAGTAWFLEIKAMTYLCGLAVLLSIMQYMDAFARQIDHLPQNVPVSMLQTTRLPLYLCSLLIVLGGVMGWQWVVVLGITAWIYFLLRWLRRLEYTLLQIQAKLQHNDSSAIALTQPSHDQQFIAPSSQSSPLSWSLLQQVKQWIFI
ncbi:hypothetical protein [Acinetobacter sp. SAAs470]|uniref:hypothetical protein n=1 Tax=unclassified Acinetobacter TaxID=196816 RepID=UPI003977E078